MEKGLRIMSKKESARIKKYKRDLSAKLRQATKERKREALKVVLEKDKLETTEDVCNLFIGLSPKAIRTAAIARIIDLSTLGFSPKEILEKLEPPKKKQEK